MEPMFFWEPPFGAHILQELSWTPFVGASIWGLDFLGALKDLRSGSPWPTDPRPRVLSAARLLLGERLRRNMWGCPKSRVLLWSSYEKDSNILGSI